MTTPPTSAPTQNPPTIPTVAPTQAPTTSSPSGPFICPGNGLFKNPTDCNSYYNCWAGVAYLQNCQTGLVFNPNGYCDWPYNYRC